MENVLFDVGSITKKDSARLELISIKIGGIDSPDRI